MTRGRADRVIKDRPQARLTSKGDTMRLITVLAVLTVVTAVTAGSAVGSTKSVRPDDRAGAKGPGALAGVSVVPVRPDDRAGTKGTGAIAGVSVASVRPDDRAGAKGTGAIAAANGPGPIAKVRPDDRAGLRGPGAFAVSSTGPSVEVRRVSSDGFDWPAAFVGAVSTLGLGLLAGAALLLRPRGRTTATS
jgi:hypothetical protein